MSAKSDKKFFLFKKKKKKIKITIAHECQIYIYTQRNMDFFGSPLKTFPDHCIRGSGTDRENGGD